MIDTSREARDPYCLTDGEADELLRGAPWRRFVVVGDSLAKGVGEPAEGYLTRSWAERTVAALRRAQTGLEYLNLGVENLRAADVRATQLAAAVEFRPDLAAVVCGGNDLLPTDFAPESVEADLDVILGSLRAAGADLVTFTLQDITQAYPMLAEGPLLPRIRALNDVVRAVSARHDAVVVEMWGHPAQSETDIYSADLMHASMRGHAIVSAETIRGLGRLIAASVAS